MKCKECADAIKDKWGIAVACSLMEKKYISNEHKEQPWCPKSKDNIEIIKDVSNG